MEFMCIILQNFHMLMGWKAGDDLNQDEGMDFQPS